MLPCIPDDLDPILFFSHSTFHLKKYYVLTISSVQSLSRVRLFVTP